MSNWGTIVAKTPPAKRVIPPPAKYTIRVSYNSREQEPWSVEFLEKIYRCKMVEFHCPAKTVLRPRTGRPPRGYITSYGTAEINEGVCYIRS